MPSLIRTCLVSHKLRSAGGSFPKSVLKKNKGTLSFRPTEIKRVHPWYFCAKHKPLQRVKPTSLLGDLGPTVSHTLYKPISVIKLLFEKEFLSLHRIRLIFETSKHWCCLLDSTNKIRPIIHEKTSFSSISCWVGPNKVLLKFKELKTPAVWSMDASSWHCHNLSFMDCGEAQWTGPKKKTTLRWWYSTRMCGWTGCLWHVVSLSKFPGCVYCRMSAYSSNVSTSSTSSNWENIVSKNKTHMLKCTDSQGNPYSHTFTRRCNSGTSHLPPQLPFLL